MLALKRAFLLVMVLVVPPLLTGLSYDAARFVLDETHRGIAPGVVRLVSVCEFILFFIIAVFEARARWGAPSPD